MPNIQLSSGSGGPSLKSDTISSVEHQQVKIQHGATGSATDVSTASPLPTSLDNAKLTAANHAITAKLATDALQDGLTALTPKFAVINQATAADHEVVALVSNKRIRVLALYLSTDTTGGNARFESGAGGAALTGIHELVEELRSWTLPFNPLGWFQTVSGESLSLEWSAAQNVDGFIQYVEV